MWLCSRFSTVPIDLLTPLDTILFSPALFGFYDVYLVSPNLLSQHWQFEHQNVLQQPLLHGLTILCITVRYTWVFHLFKFVKLACPKLLVWLICLPAAVSEQGGSDMITWDPKVLTQRCIPYCFARKLSKRFSHTNYLWSLTFGRDCHQNTKKIAIFTRTLSNLSSFMRKKEVCSPTLCQPLCVKVSMTCRWNLKENDVDSAKDASCYQFDGA